MVKEIKNQIRTIGIIMDGNRRWAEKRGLSRLAGHRHGAEKLRELLGWARGAGVETVIAYAFSTENWRRTKTEVNFLFKLFRRFLNTEINALVADKTIFRCIGDRASLPEDLQSDIAKAEARTKDLGPQTLVIAVSYGGRAEIVAAAKTFAYRYRDKINTGGEKEFSQGLSTAGLLDPDLIIRTGGEQRLSNFLPWQSVYSELVFTPTHWPAFTRKEFINILAEAKNRDRRFGK